jgi:hypothetical protein
MKIAPVKNGQINFGSIELVLKQSDAEGPLSTPTHLASTPNPPERGAYSLFSLQPDANKVRIERNINAIKVLCMDPIVRGLAAGIQSREFCTFGC